MMDNEKELNEQGLEKNEIPSVTPEQGEEHGSEPTNEVEEAPADEQPAEQNDTNTTEQPMQEAHPADAAQVTDSSVVHDGAAEAEAPIAAGSQAEPTEMESIQLTDTDVVEADKRDKSLNSEEDLAEKDDDHEDDDHEDEEVDYSTLSKEELVATIRELSQDNNVVRADRKARELKPYFDEIHDKERKEALDKFIADGGEEDDFEYRADELTDRFEANYRLIHDNKVKYIKDQENRKEANLKKKEELLEKLRELVDSEETNIEFDAFKAIQNEWKEVGPVPGAYVKTLWANWNALVDRFYDNRNIYFELKELDRKKNLEAKIELCEKAEALSGEENINEAIRTLNELHHEFKHLGPVPNDEREALWQRFKGASDAVYDRRKDFVEQLKGELEDNLKVKQELADEVQAFTTFDSDRIKEWNKKTKELQEIQKKWESTGGLPRAKAKEVNRNFWSAFKTFYNNKGAFFKKLDNMREGNLEKKQELVKRAEELKESTEWNKTAGELKKLQAQWKEVGPVPEKYRESVYKEFKAACDHFFEQRRGSMGDIEKEYQDNLKAKEQICNEIDAMAANKDNDLEKLRDLQDQFNNIGFVPKSSISSIKSKYNESVDRFINSIDGISNEDRQKIRLENQINKIKSGPNAGEKMFRKEQNIRKQISHLENDIALWKNNMEFFADSKTADKLKEEFETKIKAASKELTGLKHQLKIVRNS